MNYSNFDKSNVPVFVLCGGQGTRFREQTEFRPKPMIEIGGRPILWHIMQVYARHGFKHFVLCLGYKAEMIKAYFLHYGSLNCDFTVDLATNALTVHPVAHADDWTVTLVDTGENAMTGARVARAAAKYLGTAEHFAVTYGDGLTDADLSAEYVFHLEHGRLGTVLGINPPSRFGEIRLAGNEVLKFEEKPEFREQWINGGYFFFRRKFLDYLSTENSCVLEQAPLVRLAADDQLHLFKHQGFWQCMDTQRDYENLNATWQSGHAPWKTQS
jgi:glucose-1-phosphate cytidylyltransferase